MYFLAPTSAHDHEGKKSPLGGIIRPGGWAGTGKAYGGEGPVFESSISIRLFRELHSAFVGSPQPPHEEHEACRNQKPSQETIALILLNPGACLNPSQAQPQAKVGSGARGGVLACEQQMSHSWASGGAAALLPQSTLSPPALALLLSPEPEGCSAE